MKEEPDKRTKTPSQSKSSPNLPSNPVEAPPLPPEPESPQSEGQDSEDWSLTDNTSMNSSEPPPLPPSEMSTGKHSLGSLLKKSKGFAGKLGAEVKSAGVFATNQVEHTKLLNITTPGHYTKLGKLVFESDVLREKDEFAEILAVIDKLHAKAKDLESQQQDSPLDD